MSKAKDILENIINDFSVDKFTNLFREKNQKFEPHKTALDEYNDENFNNGLVIGKINFDDGEFLICTFLVNRHLSEKSGKKTQYEKGKKILKDTQSDAGIFIFYDQSGSFRFSLIYANYQGTRRDWSLFKRFTYYADKSFTNKTFLQRIGESNFSSLANIKEAFSVEKVTEEFYAEVSGRFFELLREIEYPVQDDTTKKEFIVRIIGRLLFLWFLKKKKSINGVPLIPEAILSSETARESKNYYHMVLEPLFFQILNTPVKDRRLDFFGKAAKILHSIPFLNGGLFEPHGHDYYETGEFGISKHLNILKVQDKWFQSLFESFESYNFTIDENTTMDTEISIDPEMLGKILENLLAEINPETGESARKSTGGYYTPRSIVEYMVNESLKEYLISITGINEEKIVSLLSYNGDIRILEITDDEKNKIINALDTVKIIDPACGSGAFVIGILNKILLILQKVDPESKKWLKKKLEKIDNELLKKDLEAKLIKENWDYIHKLGIIQGSIYGVDIQPVAVEIAKLRCFLSLIVDEKIDDNVDNRGIIPLPNLEFKFVAADSIVALPKKEDTGFADFSDESSGNIEKLKKLRMEYFTAYGNRKKEIESEFAIIQENMMKQIIKWGSADDTHTQKLSGWQPFNYAQSSWFDLEWMFGITDGFDIVIGNPPYIRQERLKSKKVVLQNQGFEVYNSTSDIYTYFYEKGWQILKDGGYLTFITSNKWLRAKYGEKLRKFLKDKTSIIDIIDFGGYKVFESATVDTNILLFKKTKPSNDNMLSYTNIKDDIKDNDLYVYIKENRGSILQSKLSENTWTLAGKETLNIKEKIESIGIPLKDWDVKIYRGITTGFNEAFIINSETRNNILDACVTKEERKRTEEIIKPILRGRDINKYSYKWVGMWIIFIPWHFPLHDDESIQGNSKKAENEFIKQYPVIYNHLLYFKEKLEKRNKEETGIRYEWYVLQRCAATYYSEFEKEKIVWREIAEHSSFTWDSENYFALAKVFIMTGSENKKFLLAVLNSKLGNFAIKKYYSPFLGTKASEFKKEWVQKMPIPKITNGDQKPFIDLIDKILDITNDNDHLQNSDKSDKIREYERQINEMIYKLYNLTKEEIDIIENTHN